ncbi:uncharacterized protein BDR25DRAFT_214372 [Lindgomyces ingoldianus]|uniref:Uncharacterized protein n=1 Tax=Lindgomyces ingoldianus TaxID=673940 RepID=A0ACB6R6N0_9PLEO|nr:uncharacterized protein BDR25DRAFT_214372 [Lindgomyces ingoldianus]KAF2474914.1 hypothetical protein BDR25DRAFT_214372 [Lindgomyces ingoldianus]
MRTLFLLCAVLPTRLSLAETSETEARNRIWYPAVQSPIQMILSGSLDIDPWHPSIVPNIGIYDIDLFDNSNDTIRLLHRLGKKVVCYFSAGTAEDWRPDFGNFTESDMGANLPLWPGERYLNIRSKNVWKIMARRLLLAKQKGCDAVDPDNIDVYSNLNGGGVKPPITERDAIRYLRQLSSFSHRLGMSIGLKNSLEILPFVTNNVEFAVNEECVLNSTCGKYSKFTSPSRGSIGKAVFHVEYERPRPSSTSWNITAFAFPDVPGSDKLKLSTFIKTLDLNGWIMWCDGRVEITKTKAVEVPEVPPAGNGTEPVDSETELEKQLDADLQGVVFPTPTGAIKDRRPGPRYLRGVHKAL